MTHASKIIKLHVSDRILFRRCKRKWDWQSQLRQGLQRKEGEVNENLWFGSGFHFALEDWHGYRRFTRAADAFRAYAVATGVRSSSRPENWVDYCGLAEGMLDYYTDHWARQRSEFRTFVVAGTPQVEVPFAIKLGGRIRGYRVEHWGTFDRVVEDRDGRLWICVAEDTVVPGPLGLCKIQDHPDAKHNGVRETVRVQTDRGYAVTCTPDHRILTESGWKEAQELALGDALVLGQHLDPMATGSVDPDYWWMVGYWLGNGSLRNHGRGSIDFATGNDDDYVGSRLGTVFSKRGETPRYAQNKVSTGYRYVTSQMPVAEHLRTLFADSWGDATWLYDTTTHRAVRRIPAVPYKKKLRLPFDQIENLGATLQGLFDADGHVRTPNEAGKRGAVELSSKSRELCEDVQVALAAFGIVCTVSDHENEFGKWSKLTVSDVTSMRRFEEYVGFGIPRKRETLQAAIVHRKARRSNQPRVISVTPGPVVPVYDLLDQPHGHFSANGLVVHNCEYKTAKQIDTLKLSTDPQVNAYLWAAEQLWPGRVEGVVYLQFAKQVPRLPRILLNGTFSQAMAQKTTYSLYRAALLEQYGRVPNDYREYLNMLAEQETIEGDAFIRRDLVRRNGYSLASEDLKIRAEARDMLDSKLGLYPNPTRDCIWDCPFREPCIMQDDGSDYLQVIQDEYEQAPTETERDWWRAHITYPETQEKEIVLPA